MTIEWAPLAAPLADWRGAHVRFMALTLQLINMTAVPPGELRWLRGDLSTIDSASDFLWALRWLRQEKHCDQTIYADLIRTPSTKRTMGGVIVGSGRRAQAFPNGAGDVSASTSAWSLGQPGGA